MPLVDEGKRKVSVSISMNKSMQDFFKEHSSKVIEVNGKKIYSSKTMNDVINNALEFAVEHVNEWGE